MNKKRSKGLLITIILGIFIGIVYIYGKNNNIVPLYNEAIDYTSFQQERPLIIQQYTNNPTENKIMQMTYENKTQDEPFNKTIRQYRIPTPKEIRIIVASKEQDNETRILIQFNDGTVLKVFTQSAFTFEKPNTITLLTGKFQYKIPKFQSNGFIYTGNTKDITYTTGTFDGDNLIKQYEKERKKYILTTQGGEILSNPLIDQRIQKIIAFLYSINPQKYGKNVLHYNEIHNYLDLPKIEENTGFIAIDTKKTQEDISKKTQEGFEQTQTYQRIQNIKGWFQK